MYNGMDQKQNVNLYLKYMKIIMLLEYAACQRLQPRCIAFTVLQVMSISVYWSMLVNIQLSQCD